MKTEAPKLVTLNLSAMDCWVAFGALGGAVSAVGKMSRKVFHKIRKTRSMLKKIYDEREDGIKLVQDTCVEKDAMGNARRTEDGQDFVWLEGKAKEGRAMLSDVNGEMHEIQIVPILWDELLPPEEDDEDDAEVTAANLLFGLADLGFVVDELPEDEGD